MQAQRAILEVFEIVGVCHGSIGAESSKQHRPGKYPES